MSNHHLLLIVIAVVASNTWRLHGKRQRGEAASYDGDEQLVTETDVLLSGAFCVLLVGAYIYGLVQGE